MSRMRHSKGQLQIKKIAVDKNELKIKIRKRAVFEKTDIYDYMLALLFIPFLPTFVSRIVDIPYWGGICYFIIFVSDLYFLASFREFNKNVGITLLFFSYFFVITVFREPEDTMNCLLRTFTGVSFVILMEYIFLSRNKRRSISVLMYAMELFHYINLFFMLRYPNGMYKVLTNGIYEQVVKVDAGSARTASRVLWLLGHQTMLIRFTLPAICIALVYCYRKEGRFQWNIRSVLLILACLIETIKANSAGNYLGLAIFFGFIVLYRFRTRIKMYYLYPIIGVAYGYFAAASEELNIFSWLSSRMQRSVQISTRVPIWINAFKCWLQKPVFGWGYINESSSRIREMLSLGNPHSTYLWALFEGGIIGILLLIFYLQYFGRKINGYWDSKLAQIIYAAFICLVCCMIDDDHIFRAPFFLIIFSLTYHIPELVKTLDNGGGNL